MVAVEMSSLVRVEEVLVADCRMVVLEHGQNAAGRVRVGEGPKRSASGMCSCTMAVSCLRTEVVGVDLRSPLVLLLNLMLMLMMLLHA